MPGTLLSKINSSSAEYRNAIFTVITVNRISIKRKLVCVECPLFIFGILSAVSKSGVYQTRENVVPPVELIPQVRQLCRRVLSGIKENEVNGF